MVHHVPHNGPGGIQGAIDGNGHISFEEDVEGGARITWMDLGLGFWHEEMVEKMIHGCMVLKISFWSYGRNAPKSKQKKMLVRYPLVI